MLPLHISKFAAELLLTEV